MIYAFNPSERPIGQAPNRQWTAAARTELGVVREMARCLREITDSRVRE